jgi:hypothetical protein
VAAVLYVFCIYVCIGRDEELAHVHVTIMRRPMQWGPSTEKKTRITTFKNKSQITNAYLSSYVGAGVLLLGFRIYVCIGRDEELAHVHVTIMRRPMQWGPSTEKRRGLKLLK